MEKVCTAETNWNYIPQHRIETLKRVRDIIMQRMYKEFDVLSDSSHFINDLKFDSLDFDELLLEIDDEFDIDIPKKDMLTINNVIELVGYIKIFNSSN